MAFGDSDRSLLQLFVGDFVWFGVVRCRNGRLHVLRHHHSLDGVGFGRATNSTIHDEAQVLLRKVDEHGLVCRLGELVFVLAGVQGALEYSVARLVV